MRPLFLLLFLTLTLFSKSLSWYGNYKKAHEIAQRIYKPMLVLVVKKDDNRSREVLRNVFMDQPYIEVLNEHVIAVMITYEGSVSYPVELYYTTEFPTLFWVDSKREIFIAEPLYGASITAKAIVEQIDFFNE